jgi:2-polyprenyl-3-methyl-5-hydroxy-6-metoxy-1,4-benzoquinol methylase
MTAVTASPSLDVTARAHQSRGTSGSAIYAMVAAALDGRHLGGGSLLDVGCGRGDLWPAVRGRFDRYLGADVVRYEGFPDEGEYHRVDLDRQYIDLPDACADVVAGVETIEHLENPRAFVRELARLARPGGWVLVTTPNQLSLLSKLTLLFKNQFNAFQDGSYPAHLTALLEVDLRRIAAECGLEEVAVSYSLQGRVPWTPWHYPRALSRLWPRGLSDNVLLIARRPQD